MPRQKAGYCDLSVTISKLPDVTYQAGAATSRSKRVPWGMDSALEGSNEFRSDAPQGNETRQADAQSTVQIGGGEYHHERDDRELCKRQGSNVEQLARILALR